MTKYVLCLMVALLLAVNVASAQEEAAPVAAGPVVVQAAPMYAPYPPTCCDPCCVPPVVYRRGLFGCVRPVVVAPVVYPVYPRYVYRGWYRGCCW